MMEAKQDLVAKPFWWQESKTNQFPLSVNFSGDTIITSILSETTVFFLKTMSQNIHFMLC